MFSNAMAEILRPSFFRRTVLTGGSPSYSFFVLLQLNPPRDNIIHPPDENSIFLNADEVPAGFRQRAGGKNRHCPMAFVASGGIVAHTPIPHCHGAKTPISEPL
jgi:hypothetical protein